jgi:hypothetical protein
MTGFDGDELRDPRPPIPGALERTAVAERAAELVRRRRFAQATGAIVAVAGVAVLVAVLTSGGTGPGARPRTAAAANSPSGDAGVAVAAPTTTAPPAAVPGTTTVPPAADTGTSDSGHGTSDGTVSQAPAPTRTVSGHVSGIPAGTIVTVRFIGAGGTFTAVVDPSGDFSISGLSPGSYSGSWESVDAAGAPAGVGQIGAVDLTTTSQTASFLITS